MSCSKDSMTIHVTKKEADRAGDLAKDDQISQEEENRKLVLDAITKRIQGIRRTRGNVRQFRRPK